MGSLELFQLGSVLASYAKSKSKIEMTIVRSGFTANERQVHRFMPDIHKYAMSDDANTIFKHRSRQRKRHMRV